MPEMTAEALKRVPAWQPSLFCGCGDALPALRGLCRRCYWRSRNSCRRFGGRRERVLARDGFGCAVCGSREHIVVHHRRPGNHDPRMLVSLCAACHARVHRTRAMRRWLPEALVPLWAEQHPGTPVQLQIAIEVGRG